VCNKFDFTIKEVSLVLAESMCNSDWIEGNISNITNTFESNSSYIYNESSVSCNYNYNYKIRTQLFPGDYYLTSCATSTDLHDVEITLKSQPYTKPLQPIVNAIDVNSSAMYLVWENDILDDGYTIYRDSVAINTFTSNKNSYLDTPLTAGTNYSYTVSAYNLFGETNSTVKSIVTQNNSAYKTAIFSNVSTIYGGPLYYTVYLLHDINLTINSNQDFEVTNIEPIPADGTTITYETNVTLAEGNYSIEIQGNFNDADILITTIGDVDANITQP